MRGATSLLVVLLMVLVLAVVVVLLLAFEVVDKARQLGVTLTNSVLIDPAITVSV